MYDILNDPILLLPFLRYIVAYSNPYHIYSYFLMSICLIPKSYNVNDRNIKSPYVLRHNDTPLTNRFITFIFYHILSPDGIP